MRKQAAKDEIVHLNTCAFFSFEIGRQDAKEIAANLLKDTSDTPRSVEFYPFDLKIGHTVRRVRKVLPFLTDTMDLIPFTLHLANRSVAHELALEFQRLANAGGPAHEHETFTICIGSVSMAKQMREELAKADRPLLVLEV